MASLNEAQVKQDVSRLWRVRRTLLEMLLDRGYAVLNTSDDLNLKLQDFEAQFQAQSYNRENLIMLRQKRDDPSAQIYVFFPEEHRGKMVGIKPISERLDRMDRDGVKNVIFVMETGMTTFAKNGIDKIAATNKITIETFNENDLLINITRHKLVPKHEVMSDDEKRALLKRYKLKESQLPRIQKSDPVARYYGLVQGTVVKITRPSETAGRYITYRLCVG